jgi:polyisoprenoid-binding protein YceI
MATWIFEPGHTEAEFRARHMMVSWVRGLFKDIHGQLELDWDHCVNAVFTGEIDATGIWTGQSQRDEHLRSADFFDVEHHPTLTFKSTAVEPAADGAWLVTGDLTVHGTTRPVVLDVTFDGANTTPWGTRAVAFSASTEIDREDFGLTYNQVLETGGVMVGKKVRIELSVEATARQEQAEGAA